MSAEYLQEEEQVFRIKVLGQKGCKELRGVAVFPMDRGVEREVPEPLVHKAPQTVHLAQPAVQDKCLQASRRQPYVTTRQRTKDKTIWGVTDTREQSPVCRSAKSPQSY